MTEKEKRGPIEYEDEGQADEDEGQADEDLYHWGEVRGDL